MSIMTVTGKIEADKIGFCHCHEHLFIASGKSAEINPALCIDSVSKTIEELRNFKNAGGNTIIDAQPVGCGRMANCLEDASKRSGVNIIASTGFHKLMFYPENHWIFKLNEEELADLYIDEIKNGMFIDCDEKLPSDRIKSKPGIIKVALDKCNLTKEYTKYFTAAVYAAATTKLPLLCHIEKDADAVSLAKFLIDKGIKSSSIIFCHLDRAHNNINYHEQIAEMGIYLEYDTIGRFKYHSDEAEIALIIQMIEKGYENQLLLGLDTTRERLVSYGGGIGLTYILNTFIPLLKEHGFSDKHIYNLTIKNPSNVLAT